MIAAMTMAGCVVRVHERTDAPKSHHNLSPVARADDPEGRHSPRRGPRGGDLTIAEIRAAGTLTFDSARRQTLKTIAERPDLSARAQQVLVDTAMEALTFDSSKKTVLLALIANPRFSPPAKRAILDRLEELTFDSTKKEILAAMAHRADKAGRRHHAARPTSAD